MITLKNEAAWAIKSLVDYSQTDMRHIHIAKSMLERFQREFTAYASLPFWPLEVRLQETLKDKAAFAVAQEALAEYSEVITGALTAYTEFYTGGPASRSQLVWNFRLSEAGILKKHGKEYWTLSPAEQAIEHANKAMALMFHQLEEFTKQLREEGTPPNGHRHIGLLCALANFYRYTEGKFQRDGIQLPGKVGDRLQSFYKHIFAHAPKRPDEANHDWEFAQLKLA